MGVFISLVLIPASQLGIRAYVYEYLGLGGTWAKAIVFKR